MSYLDASEHDDRTPEPGRSRRATRPAWDAGTYGVPDDMRRSRSPRGERDGRDGRDGRDAPNGRDGPDGRDGRDEYSGPAPSYPPEPDPYAYQSDRYPPSSYQPPPPPSYPPPPESRPLDGYLQAPSYRPDPYRYDASPAPYDPPSSSYDPPPSSYEPNPPISYEPLPYVPPVFDRSYPDPDGPDRYPGGRDSDGDGDQPDPAPRGGRTGRNMPAAIGVGVLLAGVALSALFLWRPAFLAVIAVAVGVGVWELVRAIRTNGVNPPMIPLIAGGALMTGLAWQGQADGLTFGLILTVLAVMVWRLADGAGDYGRDVTAATLVAVYVPFLAGFAALLALPADGDKRVLVTLALIVLSDTGGFVAGVMFGRHPMAPSVSPKKSWEGLGGSFVACGVGGAILLSTLFNVSLVAGALFGFAIAAAATLGDLGESMIKRDLGVKDMSNLLPGHGGLMDRLDSILVAAPTAYVIFALLVPAV